MNDIVLEPAAQRFAAAAGQSPFVYELGPDGARKLLDDVQSGPTAKLDVDENDVLRDEGEAYARRLTEAGVPTTSVRYNGTVHDFMMLDPVRDTAATTAALAQAIAGLRTVLHPAR